MKQLSACGLAVAMLALAGVGRAATETTPAATAQRNSTPRASDDPSPPRESKVAKTSTPTKANDAKQGTIKGQVTIEGTSPFKKLDLSQVVVYLASHPDLDEPVATPGKVQTDADRHARPQIVQRNKSFVPSLLVVPVGSVVEFPNWDRYSHNVFSRSAAAPPFDLDRYPYGQSKSYPFPKLGVVQLFCNIHPPMKATILVTPNRFFVKANSKGEFALGHVPPGKYELVAWHPRCEEQRQKIEVKSEEPAPASIALSQSRRRVLANHHRRRRASYGVARGLGIKRSRLHLPVVAESHPACCPEQSPPKTASAQEP